MDQRVPVPERGSRLARQVALVVGAGTTGHYPGTGSATARLFAAQGAHVAVFGRTSENTERTVADIRAAGGTAEAVVGDTTLEPDCARAVGTTVATFGGLDILVNNVAVHAFTTVADFDEPTWNRVLAGNLTASALMAKYALPPMREAGGGSVVNVGSIAGLLASGAIGYGTAKGALLSLTRDMALELGREGIRVNCVIPGHLHTPHVPRTTGGNEQRELRAALNMLGTEGDGWDAAYAALYFACDESRFVTGQELAVDGGVTRILAITQIMRIRAYEAARQAETAKETA